MFKSIPNFGWYNRFGGESEISHLNLEDSLVGVIVETVGVCECLRQRICPSAGVGGGEDGGPARQLEIIGSRRRPVDEA